MPIERLERFAPSKKPYALDLATFRVDSQVITRADGSTFTYHRPTVEAVWAGRKNGSTYISSGTLGTGGEGTTVEEFLTGFDPRYGGDCKARWNGHDLWAPGYSPAQVTEASERLDAILSALPDVPEGFDGWYVLSAKYGR